MSKPHNHVPLLTGHYAVDYSHDRPDGSRHWVICSCGRHFSGLGYMSAMNSWLRHHKIRRRQMFGR